MGCCEEAGTGGSELGEVAGGSVGEETGQTDPGRGSCPAGAQATETGGVRSASRPGPPHDGWRRGKGVGGRGGHRCDACCARPHHPIRAASPDPPPAATGRGRRRGARGQRRGQGEEVETRSRRRSSGEWGHRETLGWPNRASPRFPPIPAWARRGVRSAQRQEAQDGASGRERWARARPAQQRAAQGAGRSTSS